ncbi:DEAD/DEAH box helicase [Bermanella marisrubri]|uniref:Probable ATP-dependent RNA helicase n=1 Tax=Bermanella marisrubri TaxID=207949 RepID=Q1MYS3_9GAMM|nr:DEAD/DEAH box helicase [Bermanella marisrubri]EAT11133.1 probable ATP-dependent RNA helicase [Oceanobacter sp. RED65] [Bermanella marisrubri]QIZ83457.1 DEAD/DEAH box helicase [Bermanella marisrubri]
MFQSFSLDQRILKGIEALGFTKATDVQQQTIPEALKQQDLMVCARTGSGKTAAFVVPMLQHLLTHKAPNSGTRALILVPTRELAKQLLKQCQALAKFTGIQSGMITGGQEFKFQAALFRKNPEIIIATPGRLIDHLKQKKDLMEDVEYFILDEADRMLDMGFEEDVLTIANACSGKAKPQTLLFSATLQQRGLKHVIKQIQNDPEEIVVDSFRGEHSNIEQHYMLADDDKHKQRILTWLLSNEEYRQAIIFTNTKEKTEQTYHFLSYHNVEVGYLHGDMTQDERNHVMTQMRNGRFKVLVATDVAARGLDIQSIDLVINFDMARSGDDYVHRIGRTGRAEASGSAISLIDHTEWNLKAAIERYLRVNMNHKYVKAIAGNYKGPKKVKGNGKAASKGKPKNKKDGKKGPQSKARPTKGKRDNSNKKKPTSKRTIWGDGTAPFKPKKKPEA